MGEFHPSRHYSMTVQEAFRCFCSIAESLCDEQQWNAVLESTAPYIAILTRDGHHPALPHKGPAREMAHRSALR